ncbi:MAG: hypothetical protein U0T75_05915 [Chitinophagales bacterium]
MFFKKRTPMQRMKSRALFMAKEKLQDMDGKHALLYTGLLALAVIGLRKIF